MRTAADFIADSISGNTTGIDISAPTDVTWNALLELRFSDLRVTAPLLAIRSVPAMVKRRGSLARGGRSRIPNLLEAMTTGRFTELHRSPGEVVTVGIIGQFWKLDGGEDVPIDGPEAFGAFDRRGYVKSAIDLVVEPTDAGSRLSTTTRNLATDSATEKTFKRYWRVIGPGSKLIRIDMLRGVRRRAEQAADPGSGVE